MAQHVNQNTPTGELFRYGVTLLERLAERLAPRQLRQPIALNIAVGAIQTFNYHNKLNGIIPAISAGTVGVVFGTLAAGTNQQSYDMIFVSGYPSQYIPLPDMYTDQITFVNLGASAVVGQIMTIRY